MCIVYTSIWKFRVEIIAILKQNAEIPKPIDNQANGCIVLCTYVCVCICACTLVHILCIFYNFPGVRFDS